MPFIDFLSCNCAAAKGNKELVRQFAVKGTPRWGSVIATHKKRRKKEEKKNVKAAPPPPPKSVERLCSSNPPASTPPPMNERGGQIGSKTNVRQRAAAGREFAGSRSVYLLEAVVHHRAEHLRDHQADPDGQQQGRDDPDRGDNARPAGHVGDATAPTFSFFSSFFFFFFLLLPMKWTSLYQPRDTHRLPEAAECETRATLVCTLP